MAAVSGFGGGKLMNLEWYQKMIAAAQQRQPTQPQTQQQMVDAAKQAARSTQTFAMPAMAAADWKPKTTAEVLGADYAPPEGGPTVDQLNASPVWQSVLAQMAGAPSTIPYSGNLEGQLMPALLSGELALDLLSSWGPHPEPPANLNQPGGAPVPGGPGWINPTWGSDARPGDARPPQPSTNDLGHYMPDPTTGSTWDPYSQGQATSPTSWLGGAQQSFSQGPPTTPVVNQWNPQQSMGNAGSGIPQPGAPQPGASGYWQTNPTYADDFVPKSPRPDVGNFKQNLFGSNSPWGKPWYS
jgi:hypothetical protein